MFLRIKKVRKIPEVFKHSVCLHMASRLTTTILTLREYVNDLDADIERAMIESMIPESSRETISDISSVADHTLAMPVTGLEVIQRSNPTIGNSCQILTLDARCSEGERKVRRMVYEILGDAYTYLINYRGDSEISNPKTKRNLEADIAVVQNEEVILVIEINGDQHWIGGTGRFSDGESIYRDSYKYAKWMSYGIDVITIPYCLTDDIEYVRSRLLPYVKSKPNLDGDSSECNTDPGTN